MNQYCIYLRKSRADQELETLGQGETLARHEKALLSLAKQQHLSIGAIYREIVSGETIAARPEVQKLLNEVEQGIWSGVLVMEVERLARGNTIDQGIMAQAFQISGTKIITPLRTYDPNNEADEEYFEFNLFMSRREYKTINRRIQRGRIASIKEGKYISPVAPYGYDRVKLPGKGYSLQPNEQADVVKLIYELYVNGLDGQSMGCIRIANYLDSIGIRPMINEKWNSATISDILKNPIYAGKIRWGFRKEVKHIENGILKVTRPNSDDYIEVDGLHPAIISEQLFESALKVRKNNTRTPLKSNSTLQNPLAGLVYCAKCGKKMERLGANPNRRKSAVPTLRCSNGYCNNVSSDLSLIESEIINALDYWLKNFEIQHSNSTSSSTELASNTTETSIKQTEARLIQLQKQLDKTYTLLEQEVYTIEQFTERQKKITADIKECQSLLEGLNKNKITMISNKKIIDEFIPQCHHVLDVYNSLPDAQSKNELLKTVLVKVMYNKDKPNKKFDRMNATFELELFPAIPQI